MAHAWLALQIVGLAAVAAAICLLVGWPWALLFGGIAAASIAEVKS